MGRTGDMQEAALQLSRGTILLDERRAGSPLRIQRDGTDAIAQHQPQAQNALKSHWGHHHHKRAENIYDASGRVVGSSWRGVYIVERMDVLQGVCAAKRVAGEGSKAGFFFGRVQVRIC